MVPVALTLSLAGADPAMASLKVFEGSPTGEGQWRVQVRSAGQSASTISLCTDAFSDMKGKMNPRDMERGTSKGCDVEIVRDDRKRAEIRMACPDRPEMAIHIRRLRRRAWQLRVTGAAEETMTVRYTHVGPCTDGEPEVKLEADSAECASLGALRPEMCAYQQTGEARTACEAKITEAKQRIEAMCR